MSKALHCMALIILNYKSTTDQTSEYEVIKALVPEEVIGQVIIRIGDYRRSKRPSKT